MFLQGPNVFKLIFNKISEGIIIVDENLKIVEINHATNKMFGYQKNSLKDQSINLLIPKDHQENYKKHFNGFFKKRKSQRMGVGFDVYGVKSNCEVFPMEISLTPFEVFGNKYIMAIVYDITSRKRNEQIITELNDALEKRIVDKTKALNTTIAKLKKENKKRIKAENKAKAALSKEKELNDLKSKFLSMVSHEFKTPLSGILTSAILIEKYKLTEQQGNREMHLKTITEKVHFLNSILNDFLSVEKLESGKVNYFPTKFKLSKIVDEVIYDANMQLKEGQKIIYPDNIDALSLYQDEKVLELILTNLVNNSIKYSPENAIIEMTITQNEANTQFSIKDNGIGIPQEDQKNIFNRYFRARNVLLTRGTGIGLNIVKNHLENLKGKVSFKSKENSGTEFSFSIPNTALN